MRNPLRIMRNTWRDTWRADKIVAVVMALWVIAIGILLGSIIIELTTPHHDVFTGSLHRPLLALPRGVII